MIWSLPFCFLLESRVRFPANSDCPRRSDPRVLVTWAMGCGGWNTGAARRHHRSESCGFVSRRSRFLLSKPLLKFTECSCIYTVQCKGVSCTSYMYYNIYMWCIYPINKWKLSSGYGLLLLKHTWFQLQEYRQEPNNAKKDPKNMSELSPLFGNVEV